MQESNDHNAHQLNHNLPNPGFKTYPCCTCVNQLQSLGPHLKSRVARFSSLHPNHWAIPHNLQRYTLTNDQLDSGKVFIRQRNQMRDDYLCYQKESNQRGNSQHHITHSDWIKKDCYSIHGRKSQNARCQKIKYRCFLWSVEGYQTSIHPKV